MIEHTPYRARDQPQNGSASQDRKEIVMHKFEKRDVAARARWQTARVPCQI